MHIVHCLTHSIHGGGQAVPYLLVKSFLQYYPHVQHTVMLPAGGIYGERFRSLGVSVVEFPFNRINPFDFFRIRSVLKKVQPDIIHTHGRGAGAYVRTISKNTLPVKRIHTHHGFHLPEKFPNNVFFRWSEKYFLQNTDRVVSVSGSEAEIIARTNPEVLPKITLIPNIVDRQAVISGSKANSEYSSLMDKMKGKFIVVMIGRDDPVKNYPLAFSAAARILKTKDAVAFVFIGIQRQYHLLSELLLSYPERVVVIPSCANPLSLLAKSSVLLLTSKREAGAPLVMMEAACLGIPTIGVRVRGLYDSITNGQNGLCVDSTEEAISDAILHCANDVNLLKQLSNGASMFAHSFDVARWCEQYYRLYNELL